MSLNVRIAHHCSFLGNEIINKEILMRKLELVQRMFTFFAVVFLLPLAAFANDTLYEKAKGEGKVLL